MFSWKISQQNLTPKMTTDFSIWDNFNFPPPPPHATVDSVFFFSVCRNLVLRCDVLVRKKADPFSTDTNLSLIFCTYLEGHLRIKKQNPF